MSRNPRISETYSGPPEAVRAEDVLFSYTHQDSEEIQALAGVSITIEKGSYVVLIGRNGSGKSTLAKLINVLEIPEAGTITVLGLDTASEEHFWSIRSRCGMVFQNPDNQIVGTSVEEDVAFGPENLGIPAPEIRRRVDDALDYVGLKEYADRMPSNLSGGQKQKLAIAGVLAMAPEVLILDEATAMLDPVSRNEFLELVGRLRKEKGITVIHITHDMSEAYRADRVFVLEKGRIVLEGTPGNVFFESKRLKELGLDLPVFADIISELCAQTGSERKKEYFSSRDASLKAARDILAKIKSSRARSAESEFICADTEGKAKEQAVLVVKDLFYSYEERGDRALDNISFHVNKGEIFSVIGHSGSGKTTLISHLNGLIRPQSGEIRLLDPENGAEWNTRKNADVKEIRKRVGLLFQYPEYQLFEETVRRDILYGPLKMGMDRKTAEESMLDAVTLLGLDPSLLDRSPFELSGGQKRRVAFAGIIAMNPDILVLDEPAAGLDPAGRREIFRYILELKKRGKTILLVSHDMDEAARVSDRILVLSKGRALFDLTPEELFSDRSRLRKIGLDLPESVLFLSDLSVDFKSLNRCVFGPDQVAGELIRAARAEGRHTREPDHVRRKNSSGRSSVSGGQP